MTSPAIDSVRPRDDQSAAGNALEVGPVVAVDVPSGTTDA